MPATEIKRVILDKTEISICSNFPVANRNNNFVV